MAVHVGGQQVRRPSGRPVSGLRGRCMPLTALMLSVTTTTTSAARSTPLHYVIHLFFRTDLCYANVLYIRIYSIIFVAAEFSTFRVSYISLTDVVSCELWGKWVWIFFSSGSGGWIPELVDWLDLCGAYFNAINLKQETVCTLWTFLNTRRWNRVYLFIWGSPTKDAQL